MKTPDHYNKCTDFIEDEDFVKWRLTKDEGLEEDWNVFIKANPRLSPIFQEAVVYFERFRIYKEPMPEPDKSILFERIHNTAKEIKKKRTLYLYRNYAAAACIALIAGLGLYHIYKQNLNEDSAPFAIEGVQLNEENVCLVTSSGTASFNSDVCVQIQKNNLISISQHQEKREIKTDAGQMNKLIVPLGKRSRVELPDGTKIWLNSGSVLEFPSSFSGNSRDVSLTGEMYAEVAKYNKPFFVHTAGFKVKVYGTQFNVSAYDDMLPSVVLVEGSVGVKSQSGSDEVLLVPNDMVVLDKDVFVKKEVDVSLYTSWKDGYLIFENTPVSEVLKQISRYYNLSFVYDDMKAIEERKCSGKIYLSDNLDNVLATISLLSSTKYRKDGKKIFIDMKP